MAVTTFPSPINFISGTLANEYAIGSGSFPLRSGLGTEINEALQALGLPSISATNPLKFTVVRAQYFNLQTNQILDTDFATIYQATGLTGDTLTGAQPTEGTSDQVFYAGDIFLVQATAGQFVAIQGAIQSIESGGVPANAFSIQGTPVSSTAPTNSQALVFNGTQYAPLTLGTMAQQSAGSVAITGGTITGIAYSGNGSGLTNLTAANLTGMVTIANGGTGAASAAAGFNALSPLTTLGDLLYASGANTNARLPGNTTTTVQVLSQQGTGTASAAPVWITTVPLATALTNFTVTSSATGGVNIVSNPAVNSIDPTSTACCAFGGTTGEPITIGAGCLLVSHLAGYDATYGPNLVAVTGIGDHHAFFNVTHAVIGGGSFGTLSGCDYAGISSGTLNMVLASYSCIAGGRINNAGSWITPTTLAAAATAGASTVSITAVPSPVSTTLASGASTGNTTISVSAPPSLLSTSTGAVYSSSLNGSVLAGATTFTAAVTTTLATPFLLYVSDGGSSEFITITGVTGTTFTVQSPGFANGHASGKAIYSATAAGQTTLQLAAGVPVGVTLYIDDGVNSESVVTQTPTVTGAAPFATTLTTPLQFNHAFGTPVYKVGGSFWIGDASGESVTVSQITGSGPYTATLTSALLNNHSNGAGIYYAPVTAYIGNGTANAINTAFGEQVTITQILLSGGHYVCTLASSLLVNHSNATTVSIVPPNNFTITDIFIGGGEVNRAGARYSSILGGFGHLIQKAGQFGSIIGGQSCIVNNANAIAGGFDCVASGYGSISIGTSNIANATGAVALGTSITASGAYSFGGGNGHSLTSAATYGSAFGHGHTVSGSAAGCFGGDTNTASNLSSATLGGSNTAATGQYSACLGGFNTIASANMAVAMGRSSNAWQTSMIALAGNQITTPGDAQSWVLPIGRQTTNATPTELRVDYSAQRLLMNDNTSWAFTVWVLGYRTDTNVPVFRGVFEGIVYRQSGAASVVLDNYTASLDGANLAGTAIALNADTTNGGLQILATGIAATNVTWVGKIQSMAAGNAIAA